MSAPIVLTAATGYEFSLEEAQGEDCAEAREMLLTLVQNATADVFFTLNQNGTKTPLSLSGKTFQATFLQEYPTLQVKLTAALTVDDLATGRVKLTVTPTFEGFGIFELVATDGAGRKTKFFPRMSYKIVPSST